MRHALRLPEVDTANLLIGPFVLVERRGHFVVKRKKFTGNKILVTRVRHHGTLPFVALSIDREKAALSSE